jgi:hypothetical protein
VDRQAKCALLDPAQLRLEAEACFDKCKILQVEDGPRYNASCEVQLA